MGRGIEMKGLRRLSGIQEEIQIYQEGIMGQSNDNRMKFRWLYRVNTNVWYILPTIVAGLYDFGTVYELSLEWLCFEITIGVIK